MDLIPGRAAGYGSLPSFGPSRSKVTGDLREITRLPHVA